MIRIRGKDPDPSKRDQGSGSKRYGRLITLIGEVSARVSPARAETFLDKLVQENDAAPLQHKAPVRTADLWGESAKNSKPVPFISRIKIGLWIRKKMENNFGVKKIQHLKKSIGRRNLQVY